MYMNTPNSAYSQRPEASQAPSTPTHAPRMGVRGLPPSPHQPMPPMSPCPAGYAPYQHYGLLTPPDSPDKLPQRGQLDFHKLLDARGPLPFDVRHGMHLSGDAARERAINHAVQRMAVNVGPGFLTVEVVPTNGTTITLSDFYGQLAYALSMRADSKEVANAVQLGFVIPQYGVLNISRANLMGTRTTFAGLTLHSLQHGAAYVHCHLR